MTEGFPTDRDASDGELGEDPSTALNGAHVSLQRSPDLASRKARSAPRRGASTTSESLNVGRDIPAAVPSAITLTTDGDWNEPPDCPLDLNGPVTVPYTPFDARWLDRPILERVAAWAERHPDHAAVDDGLIRLSYREIWVIACSVGRAIAETNARPGPIAVLLPNTATYWAAVLGCFAAGRACLLLDRDAMAERNAEIIADAQPAAIVTDADGARRCKDWLPALPTVLIETAMLVGAQERATATLEPDAPAFILYTSGSAGRPKGIVQSQRNVLYRVMHFVDAGHIGETDRVAIAGAAANHAMLMLGAFAVLMSGATLYPVDVRRAGITALAGVIREHRITILQAQPSLLRVLTRLDGARELLGNLRLIRTGGEPLLHTDLQRLRQWLPRDCFILSVFGATEGALAQWLVPPDDARDPVRVANGYAPPWCQTAVLDEAGRHCRPGELGELVLRSRYVALGEWQNGQISAGRMTADPADASFRIYRTGDLVRQGEDGVIVVIGRKDRQLKIRGQRVEPIEIEGVLHRSPDVLEAAVLPRQDGDDTRLVAFVVPADGNNAKLVDSLRAMLAAALPPHMQPTRIILLDAMPVSSGGKIDAQALLQRDQAPSAATPASEPTVEAAPSQRSQAMVARAWRQTLDPTSLQHGRRFEDAGGDSLRLLQLVFHLEHECGRTLPLDAFSGTQSPADFARTLDAFLAARNDPPTAAPVVFFLPGTSKRDPRLDRLRRACSGAVTILPVDYGDWFDWVGVGFDFSRLVQRVVAQIQARAPVGPILLAGYSLGGDVAHLAAQQLIAAGRSVALVAIFATDGRLSPPGPDPVEFLTQAPGRQKIRELTEAGRHAEARNGMVRTLVGRLIRPRWFPVLWLMAWVRPFKRSGDYGFFLGWLLNMVLLHRLARQWRQTSASARSLLLAPTVLFRPETDEPDCPADLGWRARCGNLTVYDVGGDHGTMLDEPHLGPLVSRFITAVAAAVEAQALRPTPAAETRLGSDRAIELPSGRGRTDRCSANNRHFPAALAVPAKAVATAPIKAPARFISYAWGDRYVEQLLTVALPALLAPGNLPSVAATVPCEVVLLIEQRERLRVSTHPTIRHLRQLCQVQLVELDDLIATSDKYGMSLTYALHRGMTSPPNPAGDNFFFFINADFVAADGSFHQALLHLMRGERLIAAPSYCVVSEAVNRQLKERVDPTTGALVIGKRQMAKLALRNLHNTVKGKTVNQTQFHLKQMDQFYWRLNDDTLLGHQMPVAIVAMRPERMVDEPNSYWDHGLIGEFCPDAEPCVLGDSDDFLMIEVRDKKVAADQIIRGRLRMQEAGERMIGWVTPYQREFFKYPLSLHAKDLPGDVEDGRRKLAAIMHRTLSHSPARLPSHLDHPQWTYHSRGFTEARLAHVGARVASPQADGLPAQTSPIERAWRDVEQLRKEYERGRADLERARDAQINALRARVDEVSREAERQRDTLNSQFLAELSAPPVASAQHGLFFWDDREHAPEPEQPPDREGKLQDLLQCYQQQFEIVQRACDDKIADFNRTMHAAYLHYQRQLIVLEEKAEQDIAAARDRYESLLPKRVDSAEIPHVRIIANAKSARVGSLTRVGRKARLHFHRAPLQPLRRLVAAAEANGAKNVLLIGDHPRALESIAAGVPGLHAWLPAAGALSGNLQWAIDRDLKFDLCICEASADELFCLPKLFDGVKSCLSTSGAMIAFHWSNEPLAFGVEDVAIPYDAQARIHVAGFSYLSGRLERFRKMRASHGTRAATRLLIASVVRLPSRFPGNSGKSSTLRSLAPAGLPDRTTVTVEMTWSAEVDGGPRRDFGILRSTESLPRIDRTPSPSPGMPHRQSTDDF